MKIFVVNKVGFDDYDNETKTPVLYFSTLAKAEDYKYRLQLLLEGESESDLAYSIGMIQVDPQTMFDSIPQRTILYGVSLYKNGELEEINIAAPECYDVNSKYYISKIGIFKPKDKRFSRKKTLKDRALVFLYASGKDDAIKKAKLLRMELIAENKWLEIFK